MWLYFPLFLGTYHVISAFSWCIISPLSFEATLVPSFIFLLSFFLSGEFFLTQSQSELESELKSELESELESELGSELRPELESELESELEHEIKPCVFSVYSHYSTYFFTP